MPYEYVVKELKEKLRNIRDQYKDKSETSPIEFVTGRVKPVDSIQEKMVRRKISEERLENDMEDIAGVRVMCPFVENIYEVVELIRKRSDMRIIEERDYVTNAKPSGYRSYHIVIKYPLELINGKKEFLAEIQIRTLAMNFWATLEHSLNYKKNGNFTSDIELELEQMGQKVYALDQEMSSIRNKILNCKEK